MPNFFASLPQFGMIGAVALVSFFAGMLYQSKADLEKQNKTLLEWVEGNKGIYDAIVHDAKTGDLSQDGPVAPILRLTVDRLPIPARKPDVPAVK